MRLKLIFILLIFLLSSSMVSANKDFTYTDPEFLPEFEIFKTIRVGYPDLNLTALPEIKKVNLTSYESKPIFIPYSFFYSDKSTWKMQVFGSKRLKQCIIKDSEKGEECIIEGSVSTFTIEYPYKNVFKEEINKRFWIKDVDDIVKYVDVKISVYNPNFEIYKIKIIYPAIIIIILFLMFTFRKEIKKLLKRIK